MHRNSDSHTSTAVTYRACSKIIFREGSTLQWAILENVTALGQKPLDGQSDSEFILTDFALHGWNCLQLDVEASLYGSMSNRLRTFYIALKGTGRDTSRRLTKVQQWMQSMKIGAGYVPDAFVDDKQMATFLRPLPEESLPKKIKTNQDSWQFLHMPYFEAAGQAWPPAQAWPSEFDSSCKLLSDRELEITVLAHAVFGPQLQDRTEVWSMDVNDEIKRHFGNLPEDAESKEKKPADQLLRNPWKSPLIMTLVGSSHIVIRAFLR